MKKYWEKQLKEGREINKNEACVEWIYLGMAKLFMENYLSNLGISASGCIFI